MATKIASLGAGPFPLPIEPAAKAAVDFAGKLEGDLRRMYVKEVVPQLLNAGEGEQQDMGPVLAKMQKGQKVDIEGNDELTGEGKKSLLFAYRLQGPLRGEFLDVIAPYLLNANPQSGVPVRITSNLPDLM